MDDALLSAAGDSDADGLPAIQVAPNQGKLLHLLARALPDDGRLVTLDSDPHYAALATANIARARPDHIVDLRVGRAQDTLQTWSARAPSPTRPTATRTSRACGERRSGGTGPPAGRGRTAAAADGAAPGRTVLHPAEGVVVQLPVSSRRTTYPAESTPELPPSTSAATEMREL